MMVQDLINDVLFHLLEPGFVFGGVPNPDVNADYNIPVIVAKLNDALVAFVSDTEYAPSISDTVVTLPVTAGLDYQLPANLVALNRIEYAIGGQDPEVLPQRSFDEFDEATGFEVVGQQYGAPQEYREPYGTVPGVIRWNPAPNAGNVAAGDLVTIYFSANPLILVNLTDVPAIPRDYHEALSHFVLSRLWVRKNDLNMAKHFLDSYGNFVANARKLQFAENKNRSYAFVDAEDTVDGEPTDAFGMY